MSSRRVACLLPCLLVAASIPVGAAEAHRSAATSATGFRLLLDGRDAGTVLESRGGALRAPVIAQGAGTEGRTRRSIGQPSVEDLVLRVPLPFAAELVAWVQAFLSGQGGARSAVLVGAAASGQPVGTLTFGNATLVGVTFDALDGAVDTPMGAELVIRVGTWGSGGTADPVAVAGSGGPHAGPGRVARRSHFVLDLGGVEGRGVASIGSLTVAATAGGHPEAGPIALNVREPSVGPFKAWAESFLVQGMAGDEQERSGEIRLLDAQGAALMRIGLLGVGVSGILAPGTAKGGGYGVELYCEKVDLAGAPVAGAPLPSPTASAAAAVTTGPSPSADRLPVASTKVPLMRRELAAAPVPTSGDPADEGARDPRDFPRPAGMVRSAYTQDRQPSYVDERAEYLATLAPAAMEDAYLPLIESAGWEETSRSEGGELRKGTYFIDMRYKKGDRTARIVLEGVETGTRVQVRLYTTIPETK